MRLKESRIEFIAKQLSQVLLKEKFLESDDPEIIPGIIKHVIVEDLLVEDRLDQEVREILRNHQTDLDKKNVEFHRMFRLIKDKLVRERNLIL